MVAAAAVVRTMSFQPGRLARALTLIMLGSSEEGGGRGVRAGWGGSEPLGPTALQPCSQ